MCQKCKKLKAEIEKLKALLEQEKTYNKANYDAYQDLAKRFKKLAVAYCYEADVGNPLD